MTPRARSRRRPPGHRVDQYARQVLDGSILAGPYVRLACARHVRDRDRSDLHFNVTTADHAIEFIERYCRLADTADESGQPIAFRLQLWQAFIVGSLFGWRLPNRHRRFRNAFIEVGKGNGKTPLLAAIGLYGLMADGQRAPQIYAAAADRDQAMIMFRDAVRMVDASPDLVKRIKQSGLMPNVHNLAYGLGFFRPFSREQGARSGTRPHMGLIDEVHEHPSPEACAKIRAGAKGNQDALFAEITNSGFDRTSICWQHHEHSVRVVESVVDDDRWFAYVCSLDDGDDPLTDPSCHIKTNPNLGISIQPAYLADQVATAQHIPAETNLVLRLNFCVWTTGHTPAWDMARWRQAPAWPGDDALIGQPCFGGLDLGQTDDFAAWVRLWTLADGTLACRLRCWLPRATLTKYPNRPYQEWLRAGWLEVTDGDTTDFDQLEAAILEDARAAGVREIGYDRRFASQMALHFQGAGLTAVDTPQGFALTESIRSLAKLIADQQLRHDGNKVLTWMLDNTVLRTGRNQEIRLDKESAKDKIDGVSALVMANARRIVTPPAPRYQMLVFSPP